MKKLLNKKEYPENCEYCQFGRLSPAGDKILCEKKGIIEIGKCCGKYKYDPLKRVPKKKLMVESADPEDFKL